MYTPTPVAASVIKNEPFIDRRNAKIEGVTLVSVTRDDSNSPTTQLRKGLVVAYDGGTLKFVDALDATADAHVAPAVTSSEAPDADWASKTYTFEVEGYAAFTISSGGGDNSLAAFLTLLGASAAFMNLFTAADNGSGLLLITSRVIGKRIKVTSSLSTAFGASGQESSGTLVKHGILLDEVVSMLDIDDAAHDRRVDIVTANAVVDGNKLYGLTQAARTYFALNGIVIR